MKPVFPTIPWRAKPAWRGATSGELKLIGSTVTLLLPANCILPAMREVEPTWVDCAEIPLVPMARIPPELTVGAAAPPPLLPNTKPAKVLSPTRFKTDGPFKVTRFSAAICPLLVFIFTVAPLSTRPLTGKVAAGMITDPEVPLRFSVPPLTMVPPV